MILPASGNQPAGRTDRDREGYRGAVKSVRILSGRPASSDGDESEESMVLKGVYLYDSSGNCADWRTYTQGTPQSHFLVIRESIRHTASTLAYDGRDRQIYRIDRLYTADGALMGEFYSALEAATPWKIDRYTYDSLGREVSMTDSIAGEVITTTTRYDHQGRIAASRSVSGKGGLLWERRYGYDTLGLVPGNGGPLRIRQKIEQYDATGHRTGRTLTLTDSRGTVRQIEDYAETDSSPLRHQEFDSLGRLRTDIAFVADSGEYRRQAITYDYRGTPIMFVTSLHARYPDDLPEADPMAGEIVMVDCDYDAHGNWIRQIWKRKGGNGADLQFEPYLALRREFTYYGDR
jgi:YD repeat-containing protein